MEAKCRLTGRSESGSLVERRCSLNLSPKRTCVAFDSINHALADTGVFQCKSDTSTWSIDKYEGVGVEAGFAARPATGERTAVLISQSRVSEGASE